MVFFAISWLFWLVLILSLHTIPDTSVCLFLTTVFVFLVWKLPRMQPFLAAYFCALLSIFASFMALEARQLRSSQVSQDLRLVVQIASVPQSLGWGQRFDVKVLSCLSCSERFGPKKLQLSWYQDHGSQAVSASEQWELTVRLKPFRGLRNAGSFDRAKWAIYKGLDGRGYVRTKFPTERRGNSGVLGALTLRHQLATQLQQLPSAGPMSGLISALILGIKNDVGHESWSLLRLTGTSHLLAISGLHISLLAAFAFGFAKMTFPQLKKLLVIVLPSIANWDIRTPILLFGLGCASVYALLAGFELPVRRAMIMLMVWAFAQYRLRHLGPVTGLLLAMLIILIDDVLGVLSPGFWLSFGTVAILFYLHRGRLHGATGQFREAAGFLPLMAKLQGALRTHISLGIVLLPITAWFFQTGSLIGPIANLLAVPWVGFVIVPLSFISVILAGSFTVVADRSLSLAQWSLEQLFSFFTFLSQWENASLSLSLPGFGIMILAMLGLLLLFLPKGVGLQLFAIPLLLPAIAFNISPSRVKGFELHVLDVGQGLAALVFTPTHTLLFDTGGKVSGSLSMFEAAVLPYLIAQGRRHIDTLVISHDDQDHGFGYSDVLAKFPGVRQYVGGEHLDSDLEDAEHCKAGKFWIVDDVVFSFVHPDTEDRGGDNNRSCGLLVHHGASRVLLLGDIERSGEHSLNNRLAKAIWASNEQPKASRRGDWEHSNPTLWARLEQFPIDVIIAPHHGSQTSSSEKLLKRLTPEYVVFPAGFRNRYGFPHAEVQLRYKLVGAKQFVTGMQGAVKFAFGRVGLLEPPETWGQVHRRFWHGYVNPACLELFSEQGIVFRQLLLAQKGHNLCGK